MDTDGSSNVMCLSVQKLSYGLGHIFNDLCAAMWFSYTLFYLQVVINMGPSNAGILIMIGQLVDSIATPIVGYFVDYFQHRRLWHLAGTAAVTVGFYFLFSMKPDSFSTTVIVYYIFIISLFQIGWATVQISHLSIIPEISRNHQHSSDLTAIRYIASVCCNICVYLVTLIVLKSDGITEEIGSTDFYKFKEIALIIVFIGLLSTMFFYCGLLAKYDVEENEPLIRSNGIETEIKNLNNKHFLKSAVTYIVSVMYMCARLFTTLTFIYIPLYLDERGILYNIDKRILRQAIASIPLTCYIASFLTSIFVKNLIGVLKDKVIYLLGSLIGIAVSIWIGIGLSANSDMELYIIAVLLGITGSTTTVSSLCFTATFVKINGFGSGKVYSMITFTDKLISGTVVLIVQHLQCSPKNECPYFYKDVLTFISATVSIVALVALFLLHIQSNRNMCAV